MPRIFGEENQHIKNLMTTRKNPTLTEERLDEDVQS